MSRDTLPEVIRLAVAFAEELALEIGADNLDTVNARNFPDGYPRTDGCCASHDFCDADMVMDTAWRRIIGRPVRAAAESDAALFNDAWDIARVSEFFPNVIRNYFSR